MKKLTNALLKMFRMHIRVKHSINFVKSTNRNKLGNELTVKYVKLINKE